MKHIKILIFIFLLFGSIAQATFGQQNNQQPVPVNGNGTAQQKSTTDNGSYQLLEPLPGIGSSVDPNTGFGDYANKLIRLIIGAAGALAVVMIVIGGIQYMSTDAVGEKSSGKETMQNALIGLGLALVSYLLLYTINPQLTVIKDNLVPEVSVEVKDIPKDVLLAIESDVEVDNTVDAGVTGSPKRICNSVSECNSMCKQYDNGKTYTGNNPGVLPESQAVSVSGVPLVTSTGINNKVSPTMLQGLKKIEPAVKKLILEKKIPDKKYTFEIYSGYRPVKDQFRVWCSGGNKKEPFGKFIAAPGGSNHGSGRAADIHFYIDGVATKNCTPNGAIEQIMTEAGWERYDNEGWHFEYPSSGASTRCRYPNCNKPTKC